MFTLGCFTKSRLRPPVLKLLTNMARSNSEAAPSRLSFESLTTEYQICRRKLESKCEALLILSRELDQCRSERDQFKLMAEQLRDRYQMVKRQLTGDTPMSSPLVEIDPKTYSDIQTQSLARLLFDTKEANKSLKFEVEDLKQKLHDAEGDIKLLREQIVRSRVGTTDEGLNTRHFPAHEREDLVKQLEVSREEFVQLERDLQQVLDEKEELVTERDAYRTKYERLNTELNYILGGDEKRIVDIDALSMENKYLQERLKQMEEEKTMAMATVTKYKSILEKKKTKGILKLGQSRSGGLVITQKQVSQIMQSRSSITPTPQALADLQGLCGALLDTIGDKNLALSHQRKTNKLLGSRVSELEKKLKTLEMSGLWSVSGNFQNLEKLKAECEEIKTLVPRKFSHSTDTSEPAHDASDLESNISSITNSLTTSPSHQKPALNQLSRLDLEELDLLPTKEEVVIFEGHSDTGTTPGAEKLSGSKCERASTGTDTTIGISDVETENTYSVTSRTVLAEDVETENTYLMTSRTAIAEAVIKSFLGEHKNRADASVDEWDIAQNDDHSHVWIKVDSEMDSEDRIAAIQRCLRPDSDDEDEAYNFNTYSGNDAEDEDEDEEVSEEFRTLLESLTQKLLKRSQHQREHGAEKQQSQLCQQHVAVTKDKNVYIRDDFDHIAQLQPDASSDSVVDVLLDGSLMSAHPQAMTVAVASDNKSKTMIQQDSLVLDIREVQLCEQINCENCVEDTAVSEQSTVVSASGSETKNEHEVKINNSCLLQPSALSSEDSGEKNKNVTNNSVIVSSSNSPTEE